ncbi:muscarinic acetylcholine receptor M2-like [Brienomyrus brachyistius]|uniref:muscarinic acetylcholine receptor M2-like n=1 Tax=Brienomyrus brachyistius TaxID=42636 RepID=UPI0020B40769|nr:muscarinic acetylcholine receptor M2-like [Brienomyrus brachyistius]
MTLNLSSFNETWGSGSQLLKDPYKMMEVVFIVLVAGSLSLITIIGNILVMLSIKVNRNLQTVNNYFLFSLACADLIIGLCSMNLYTVYIVIGYWPMGPVVCDLWLALDYVVSNASVMNLLIISFDRYFCVTKPLSYPIKRTTKMAGMMIAGAWVLSFILWAPAILFWQFIVGVRTVPEKECYIQFFSNAAVTFGTAIAAFYLPVIIMTFLYWQISRASRSRVQKDKQMRPEVLQKALHKKQAQSHSNKANDNKLKAENTDKNQTPSTEKETSGHNLKLHNGNGAFSTGCLLDSKSSRSKVFNNDGNCMITSAIIEIVPEVEQQSQNIVRNAINSPRKKKMTSSREKKVTRTIMAILVAFVVTWTPYNVMVLINTFCSSCIPITMWTIGYWLCYINSTVNPACYALCNVTFKKTFKHLLLCQYKNSRSAR